MSKSPGIHPQVRRAVLVLGTTLGVICLVWSVGLALMGVSPVVVTDPVQSRGATLPEGTVAFTRVVGVDQARPGDAVTLEGPGGAWLTRWVTGRDGARLQVAGPRTAGEVAVERSAVITARRVSWHVPVAGKALRVVASPLGAFTAGALAVAALMVALTDQPRRTSRGRAGSQGRTRARTWWAVLITWTGLLASIAGQGWGQAYL